MVFMAAAASGERQGPLSEVILHHELITLDPVAITAQHRTRRNLDPSDVFRLDFIAYDEKFKLRMRHASEFLDPDFHMEFHTKDGVERVRGFEEMGAFYYGTSEGAS